MQSQNYALNDDTQFTIFSTHAIDIQLNGQGSNTTNSYVTYSPNMHPAPKSLQTIVINHEQRQPTAHTVNAQTLARCQFISTGLEPDNIRATQEWLITTQDGCTASNRSEDILVGATCGQHYHHHDDRT